MNLNDYIDKLNNSCDISNFFTPHKYLFYNSTNKEANFNNVNQFDFVYNKLLNLVLNMFKWNLGDNEFNLNPLMFEIGFIFLNGICLFNSNKYGILCLPAQPSRKFNIYNEPIEVIVSTGNGERVTPQNKVSITNISRQIDISEFNVGIYQRDFKTYYRLIRAIMFYAYKIADKEVALDILTQRLKDPFTFICDKEEEPTINKYFEKIKHNDPIIIGTSALKINRELEAVSNNFRPELITAMKEAILFDLTQFIEFIGINCDPNPDKAERKIVDEENSNNELIKLQLQARLDSRKEFCKKAKESFNIDIDVDFNYNEMQNKIEELKKTLLGDNYGNTETDGTEKESS